jgi:hypothetical protein
VPAFKTIQSFIELLFDYYYVVGPIELGPYYTFYSNNPIEGDRFKFGMRTSNNFSTKYRIGGHIAYGTIDERFKYGVQGEIMFDRNPRRRLEISHMNDMRQLGKNQKAFLDDNILRTILRRRHNYKLTMMEDYSVSYEHEWFQGCSNTLNFYYSRIFPTSHIPLDIFSSEGSTYALPSLSTAEISLNTHLSYKEKFLLGKFERISLGSIYPSLDIDLTYAPINLLENRFEYIKLKVSLYDKLETNPFGYTKYWIKAGKIFGEVPYPFLELHEGNETYAYVVNAFNMMNYYEFASDEYLSIFAEQHFQGFFLNKIPLLRRLEWREVASAKFLIGRISAENNQVMPFPEGLRELSKPYIEAGAGLENIFKLFRVETVWRLSYRDNPEIKNYFGLRVLMQLTF